jgi:hypothetical protein
MLRCPARALAAGALVVSLCLPAPARAVVECRVVFRVDDAARIGSLQFEADYSASAGEIAGSGEDADCTAEVAALAGTFDIDAQALLAAGLLTPSGFATPADVLGCRFLVPAEPATAAGISVDVLDAATPGNVALVPPPVMSARVECPGVTTTTSTTTTTVPADVCGKPCASGQGEPQATDALFMLRAALGLVPCAQCVCDVDRSGDVAATDALRVLARAIGSGPALDCVPCTAPFVPACG